MLFSSKCGRNDSDSQLPLSFRSVRSHRASPYFRAVEEAQLKALLVEDDPSISDFIRLGLRYEGFDVHLCADGLAALRTAERLRPDVVVLDWMLPGMDGLEVCKRLRA